MVSIKSARLDEMKEFIGLNVGYIFMTQIDQVIAEIRYFFAFGIF